MVRKFQESVLKFRNLDIQIHFSSVILESTSSMKVSINRVLLVAENSLKYASEWAKMCH